MPAASTQTLLALRSSARERSRPRATDCCVASLVFRRAADEPAVEQAVLEAELPADLANRQRLSIVGIVIRRSKSSRLSP